jgi:uncharacterized protein (TIGR02611 family)
LSGQAALKTAIAGVRAEALTNCHVRESIRHLADKLKSMPRVRRILIGIIGMTVLLIGIALTVLPGPAFVIIPIGLAILASEFVWAKRVMQRGRFLIRKARNNVMGRENENP